jgi:hypothetical protein
VSRPPPMRSPCQSICILLYLPSPGESQGTWCELGPIYSENIELIPESDSAHLNPQGPSPARLYSPRR